MKKIIIVSIILVLAGSFVFTQAQDPGFSNTVYTNVGTIDRSGSTTTETKFSGFTDYFTANVQASGLTIAGDIAWQVLDGGTSFTAKHIAHNFNAIMTPFSNFNIGIGTNLDWKVGPTPFTGPSYAAYEVVEHSVLPYTNEIKNHFADDSFAIRYSIDDVLEAGFGLNNGEKGNNGTGIGIKANLSELFSLGFAYNGTFSESNSNIYLGGSIYAVSGFDIDIWTNFEINTAQSVGGRLTFYKDGFRFEPEVTLGFWEATDSMSLYAAIIAEMSLSDDMLLGANANFGLGNDPNTDNDEIDGGSHLNITPHFVWNLTKAHRLSIALNITNIWDEGDGSELYWGIPISWRVLF